MFSFPTSSCPQASVLNYHSITHKASTANPPTAEVMKDRKKPKPGGHQTLPTTKKQLITCQNKVCPAQQKGSEKEHYCDWAILNVHNICNGFAGNIVDFFNLISCALYCTFLNMWTLPAKPCCAPNKTSEWILVRWCELWRRSNKIWMHTKHTLTNQKHKRVETQYNGEGFPAERHWRAR